MKLMMPATVMISPTQAHRRVELFLFADAVDGPFHVLSFSGGHGRLPSLEKGQGPMADVDNARFVLASIVRGLAQRDYVEAGSDAAIWEVYARKTHKRIVAERNDRPDYDNPLPDASDDAPPDPPETDA
ncbi:MAG: hypothetical protein P1U64_04160 [Alcanivoracaceae bacterium]|nr:hypothetical protein [Alcanivoracaceae bacterium]